MTVSGTMCWAGNSRQSDLRERTTGDPRGAHATSAGRAVGSESRIVPTPVWHSLGCRPILFGTDGKVASLYLAASGR